MVVGEVHRCDTVDLMDLPVADGDDGQLIPVGIDEFLARVAHAANHLRRAVFADDHPLKTLGNNPPPLFGVEHAEILGFGMEIGLIALDDKVFSGADQLAAILHPGVVARKANLGLEDEVGDLAALPDQKRVAFGRVVFRGLAEDRPSFDGPESWLASPARKVVAIEQDLCVSAQSRGCREGQQEERQEGAHGSLGQRVLKRLWFRRRTVDYQPTVVGWRCRRGLELSP